MDLTRSHMSFTRTSLTLIEALGDTQTNKAAIAELTRIYWPSVYSFLRKSGYGREQAAEITQSFFVKKVYEGDFFESFDAERGRLRSLILRSVKNYAIDQHRRTKKVQSNTQSRFMLDTSIENWEDADSPEEVFDRRWAIAQLTEAVSRCETYFVESGRENHWRAFKARILQPSLYCTDPPPLRDLANDLGFKDAASTAAAVQLVKRRVSMFLQELVNESVPDPCEAEAELQHVISFLSV